MRTIAVATTSRAEYSTCRAVVRALSSLPTVEPVILAGGTHLLDAWGCTIEEIESEGIAPVERIGAFGGSDELAAARAIGAAAASFGEAFAARRPDVLLVVGDRVELLGVAGAALPFRIPVAHVSGGDVTGGAIDDVVRHAVSKLAHLHFVAMEEHAVRLESIGEARWRITVTGDPALDHVRGRWPDRAELAAALGVDLQPPIAVVGVHPTTLSAGPPDADAAAVLEALADFPGTIVLTHPGADPGAAAVVTRLEALNAGHPRAVLRTSLGQDRYYALLAHADILVGNSSSGIWEAPSFELPVVNVGERQAGRVRARNVVDAPADAGAVAAAVTRALDPEFRAGLRGLVNPYGDGRASERIADVLERAELGLGLVAKRSP